VYQIKRNPHMTNRPEYNPAVINLNNASKALEVYYWSGDTKHIGRARYYLQSAFQDTLTKEQLDIVAPYPGD
jgi:hypothetical protein